MKELFKCPECDRRNQCNSIHYAESEQCPDVYVILFYCNACGFTWKVNITKAQIKQLRKVAEKTVWAFTYMMYELSEAFSKLKPVIEEWGRVYSEAKKEALDKQ